MPVTLSPERQAARNRLEAFAESVVPLLPGDWSVEEPKRESDGSLFAERHVSVRDGHGRRFSIDADWRDSGKVRFTPDFENTREVGYPRDYPSINVSLSRDPQSAAKDVARRFLPACTLAIDVHREAVRRHLAHERQSQDGAERVAAVFGTQPSGRDSRTRRVHLNLPGTTFGHFDVSGDRVAVELHGITVEQALAIARVLKGAE